MEIVSFGTLCAQKCPIPCEGWTAGGFFFEGMVLEYKGCVSLRSQFFTPVKF
jgi:hypothetical protein